MNAIRIVWNGLVLGREEFRTFWRNWRVWLLTQALRMTTSAATFILLGRLLGSEDVVRYLVVGHVALIGPQMSGWTIQAFTWDRMFVGTYVHLIAAPSSLVPVMVGRTAIWLFNGVATATVLAVVLFPAFGVPISIGEAIALLLICALMCVASYGFWFCAGTLVNFAPSIRNIVHNVLTILLGGICGVVVPVSAWPSWVQLMAAGLPVTHGLLGMRTFLDEGWSSRVAFELATEILVGACWFALGMVTLDKTVDVARRHGRVEMA